MNNHEQNESVNVLIVDDEEFACLNLEKTLTNDMNTRVNVVGAASSTEEAELKIKQHKPDIVFFDIEMPNENAFDFLERMGSTSFEVIFVTAYSEYAIKAFKQNAVDYILKPISGAEVANAVRKAKERLAYKTLVAGNLPRQPATAAKPDKLKLKINNCHQIIEYHDILYLEAKGSYCVIYFYTDTGAEQSALLSTKLSEYEKLLPAEKFLRTHRSYLVNYSHVLKILSGDQFSVVMKNKAKLPVSRRSVSALMSVFKK